MENILTIKERILYLAKCLGFTYEDFCKKIDMTYANFKGSAKLRPINSNTIAKILTIEPNLNLNWLITGEGDMLLKDQTGGKPPPATRADDECKQEVEFYKRLLEKKEAELKQAYIDMGKLQANCKVKKESPYSDRTESFSKLTNKGEKTNEKSQS